MRKRIGTCLVIVLCVVALGGTASAVSAVSWHDADVTVRATGPAGSVPVDIATCAGRATLVEVKGLGSRVEACVYGATSDRRLARYWSSENNGYFYAFAFADDTSFTPISGACEYSARCVYSPQEDTLLEYAPFYNGHRSAHSILVHFSGRLYKSESQPSIFAVRRDDAPIPLSPRPMATNAAAVSENGRWAIVEFLYYGFVRIDLRTLEMKRVIAPGADYGLANDPVYELAISNDGKLVAVTGWRAGIDLYEVIDGCGDTLTPDSERGFANASQACLVHSVNRDVLFPDFYVAQQPRFLGDGSRLSLLVFSNQTYSRVIIAPASSPLRAVEYLAFGDSFTSGEGELSDIFYVPGTNTSANRCHVSTRSYPYLVGRVWGMMTQNRACSGSRAMEVARALDAASGEYAPPQIVTVGVGGNDIALMDKLKTCLAPGTCEWALPETRAASSLEIQALFPKIVELIQQTRALFPSSRLLLIGYPEVINDAFASPCSPLLSAMLDESERRYMNEVVRYINRVLQQAANYERIEFFDAGGAYGQRRLCDVASDAMNGVRFGDDIAPISSLASLRLIGAESFHPTPVGHSLLAQAIAKKYTQAPGSSTCSSCEFVESGMHPTAYWSEATPHTGGVARIIAGTFLEQVAYVRGEIMKIRVATGTFLQGRKVHVEVHSTPQYLGEYEANADGSIQVDVATRSIPAGYHTVHLTGTSKSGEAVDVYKVVYIGDGLPGQQVSAASLNKDDALGGSLPTLLSRHYSVLGERRGQSANQQGATRVATTPFLAEGREKKGVEWVWISLFIVAGSALGVATLLIHRQRKKRTKGIISS